MGLNLSNKVTLHLCHIMLQQVTTCMQCKDGTEHTSSEFMILFHPFFIDTLFTYSFQEPRRLLLL